MKYLTLLWICSLGTYVNPLTTGRFFPLSAPAHDIIGKWYLREQAMFINGKEVDQHFSEVAATLAAESGYQLDPYMLADKFKKGFRGIPSGTIFEFNDDFSYRIILPNHQIQQGMWRIKNAQMIVLYAHEQQMQLEIRSMEAEIATISIQEEKIDDDMPGSRSMKMELLIGLSR